MAVEFPTFSGDPAEDARPKIRRFVEILRQFLDELIFDGPRACAGQSRTKERIAMSRAQAPRSRRALELLLRLPRLPIIEATGALESQPFAAVF